jgi:NitT/TauT family transport system substrate-binding protein
MSRLKFLSLVIMTVFGVVSPSACTSTKTPEALTPITIQLQTSHKAQFAGLYAADQNGDYTAEGLKVTFIEGGLTVDHKAAVANGTAQFGTTNADELIIARAQGIPLRAIATILRRNPLVFITLSSSGITSPRDFAGKTIRTSPQIIPTLHAMTARVGITPDQYSEVTLPWDVQLFASGDVPVWNAYMNGQVITVQQAGYKINLIYPDDYGIHFYSDSIYATDEYIAANPELTLVFLRASLKGWQYAVENPGNVGALVAKYNTQADLNLEYLRMLATLPLVNTGEDHIGWMKPEIWAGMEQTLGEQGVLAAPLDVTKVYTMQFLEEIYK